jgi:hypothetical protein
MDLLASCNQKDLSRAATAPASQDLMQRLRDLAREALAKSWIYDFSSILRDLVGIRRCLQAVGAGGPRA